MADNITFHQYNNLHDIEDSWRSLDQQAERLSLGYIHYTYYQTYEWNEFLYHHTLRGLGALTTAMRYDLVRVGGRPFAILPMAVTRSSKKARIPSCRVGGVLNMVCPYPYEGHEEVMEAIAAHLRSPAKGMTLSLADVPCCTALARIMPTLSPNPIERTSFHVPLSQFASHEAYVASLPKNIYKNIRKAYNHLTTDGKTMELKVFDHAHQAPAHTLRHLWRFYFRRKMMWRSQKANALTHLTTTLKAIYEVKSGCATASLRQLPSAELYVLEIDHQPASFMIVYRHRDHLLMPRLAIDTSFGRYSPGILLILEAAKRWMAEGVVDFDMCRGDERYKKEMGGINEPLCRIETRVQRSSPHTPAQSSPIFYILSIRDNSISSCAFPCRPWHAAVCAPRARWRPRRSRAGDAPGWPAPPGCARGLPAGSRSGGGVL